MKTTPKQVEAAKAWTRSHANSPISHEQFKALEAYVEANRGVRGLNSWSDSPPYILLAALEAAEQDGARLDWLDAQGDAVYYDGERGTVWMVDTDEECCDSVRAAIDAARREEKP